MIATGVPPFTFEEACAASDEWGFNCGPAAVSAVCGISLTDLRPHLGGFEEKRYTNPTLMAEILLNAGVKVLDFVRLNWKLEMERTGRKPWPRQGLARIQWEGPWMRPEVPMQARYRHTHWVGVRTLDSGGMFIFDINAMSVGGWITAGEWEGELAPWLIKECCPKGNGKWHITHTVEVAL